MSATAYQSDDIQAVAGYQSVSVLAVVALVVGLISPLALLTPTLIVVPAMAVFLSLLALRQIGRSSGLLVGRKLALAGLALALFSGAATVASGWVVESLLTQQAKPWALMFCQLVRDGQEEAALELTLPPQQRRQLNEDLRQFYATTEAAQQALDEFRGEGVVDMLRNLAPADTIEVRQTQATLQIGSRWQLAMECAAVSPEPGVAPILFTLVMEKRPGVKDLPGAWLVFQRSLVPRR